MIELKTTVEIQKFEKKISHADKIMFIGSCFTENIGNKLLESLFKVDVNPFGVLYNPTSIKKSLEILIEGKKFTGSDLKFYNNLWFSYFHHSKFSHKDKDICLQNINNQLEISSNFIREAKYLFITFGTAWVYKLATTQQTVSNCHKVPAPEFTRELLNIENIVKKYNKIILLLKEINPDLQIIFTLSPVRHLKDGAVENQRSKAILHLSISQLVDSFENCYYFPSYEIMMDELRDYRFYKSDMTHINDIGIEYIWKKFEATFFTQKTLQKIKEAQKLVRNLNHKPKDPDLEEYKNFKEQNLEKIKRFFIG